MLLVAAFMVFGATAQNKSDEMDVMVINPKEMGIPKHKIEDLIRRKVAYHNRLFEKNDLLIKRGVKSIEYFEAPVEFGNLSLEATSLSISSAGLPPVFDGTAFSNRSLEEKITRWLKKNSENYKVILIPRKKQALECGMSFRSNALSFSLIYLAETGQCASDWLLAHELGHQDGLVHEGESEVGAGGDCPDQPSLMHSGLQGERDLIFGNPSECAQGRGKPSKTPYDLYKERSERNKKGAYRVQSESQVPVRPIVISEQYEIKNMDVHAKIVLYNPTRQSMKGTLRLIDLNAPVSLKNRSVTFPEVMTVKPKGVTYHEVTTTREKLLGYGETLKVSAEINWQ